MKKTQLLPFLFSVSFCFALCVTHVEISIADTTTTTSGSLIPTFWKSKKNRQLDCSFLPLKGSLSKGERVRLKNLKPFADTSRKDVDICAVPYHTTGRSRLGMGKKYPGKKSAISLVDWDKFFEKVEKETLGLNRHKKRKQDLKRISKLTGKLKNYSNYVSKWAKWAEKGYNTMLKQLRTSPHLSQQVIKSYRENYFKEKESFDKATSERKKVATELNQIAGRMSDDERRIKDVLMLGHTSHRSKNYQVLTYVKGNKMVTIPLVPVGPMEGVDAAKKSIAASSWSTVRQDMFESVAGMKADTARMANQFDNVASKMDHIALTMSKMERNFDNVEGYTSSLERQFRGLQADVHSMSKAVPKSMNSINKNIKTMNPMCMMPFTGC